MYALLPGSVYSEPNQNSRRHQVPSSSSMAQGEVASTASSIDIGSLYASSRQEGKGTFRSTLNHIGSSELLLNG